MLDGVDALADADSLIDLVPEACDGSSSERSGKTFVAHPFVGTETTHQVLRLFMRRSRYSMSAAPAA